MTRERAKELAPIIAAYGEGKMVVGRVDSQSPWVDIRLLNTSDDAFFPAWMEYRVAEEPPGPSEPPAQKMRPMTRDEVLNFLAERPNVLVRMDEGPWLLPGEHGCRDISRYSYCLVTNGVRSEPRKFEIEEEV